MKKILLTAILAVMFLGATPAMAESVDVEVCTVSTEAEVQEVRCSSEYEDISFAGFDVIRHSLGKKFQSLDVDHNGMVTRYELSAALRQQNDVSARAYEFMHMTDMAHERAMSIKAQHMREHNRSDNTGWWMLALVLAGGVGYYFGRVSPMRDFNPSPSKPAPVKKAVKAPVKKAVKAPAKLATPAKKAAVKKTTPVKKAAKPKRSA